MTPSRAEMMLATFPAPPTGDGDTTILEAHRQAQALDDWLNSTKGKSDDEVDLVADAMEAREDLIASGRAESPAAILAKVRLLDRALTRRAREIAFSTAIDALERLAAGDRP